MTIQDLKKEMHWTDADIARLFQYKTKASYYASSARPRIEAALVKFRLALAEVGAVAPWESEPI